LAGLLTSLAAQAEHHKRQANCRLVPVFLLCTIPQNCWGKPRGYHEPPHWHYDCQNL
jgi:hypothetical protein